MSEIQKKEIVHTTVTISKAEKQRLDKFCKKYELKNSEFISLALDYFIGNAINPKDDDRNLPKDEIKKILKAINDTRGATFDFNKKELFPWIEANLKRLTVIDEKLEAVKNIEAQNSEFLKKIEGGFSALGMPL